MTRATAPRTPRIPSAAFAVVEEVGLTLPGVAVATKYDGSPLLKLGALVRLSRIDRDALRDILAVSWRLTAAKSRRATASPRGSSSRSA